MMTILKKGWNVVKRFVKPAAVAVVSGVVAVGSYMQTASAAIDLSDFSIDLTPVETLVPIILIGGAGIWVVRKLVKTTNRS